VFKLILQDLCSSQKSAIRDTYDIGDGDLLVQHQEQAHCDFGKESKATPFLLKSMLMFANTVAAFAFCVVMF
jgi:hypothetical protein